MTSPSMKVLTIQQIQMRDRGREEGGGNEGGGKREEGTREEGTREEGTREEGREREERFECMTKKILISTVTQS